MTIEIPVRRLAHAYHVGTRLLADRKRCSYEGDGLSVSLCPDAWQRIAKLGGVTWDLTTPAGDITLLDMHAFLERECDVVTDWAAAEGLGSWEQRWAVAWFDDDDEAWRASYLPSREAALDEAKSMVEVIFSADEVVELDAESAPLSLVDLDGAAEPGTAVVFPTMRFELTPAARARCRGNGNADDGLESAAMLWVEDVARMAMPELAGAWWEDRYDPEGLSAPRGVVLTVALDGMHMVDLSAATNAPDALVGFGDGLAFDADELGDGLGEDEGPNLRTPDLEWVSVELVPAARLTF